MNTSIRPVIFSDLPVMLAWGQNPLLWEHLPSSRKEETLTWEKHLAWFESRDPNKRQDWMIFSGLSVEPVGVIHRVVDQPWRTRSQSFPEVGLYIGDYTLWGQGIAKDALDQVIKKSMEEGFGGLHAVIHPKNKRSIRLFTAAGFIKTNKKGRNKQDVYELNFRASIRYESKPVSEAFNGIEKGLLPSPV